MRWTTPRPARRLALLVALMALAPVGVLAQTPVADDAATPGAGTPGAAVPGIILAAGNLENPRGFTWGPDGEMYVALAGSGGTTITTSNDASTEEEVFGPTLTGETATVVRIVDGCGVPVVTGLPSTQDPFGDVQGPVDVGFLGDQLYILQDATGGYEATGPDFPNGLYTVTPSDGVRLVSDLSSYVAANPAGNLYHVLELGEPFAMVAGTDRFWVVDANQGLVLGVELSGTVSLVADLSDGHPVPTAITIGPDGSLYVGYFMSSPHLDGTAKVVQITPDGEVSDYWVGLTAVTGLAMTADGTMYAVEMATGNQVTEPNISPNTGRLVRQTGPASLEPLVTGLDFPISLGEGPDGGLYISMPAIATSDEPGGILRVDPGIAGPVAVPAGIMSSSACGGAAAPAVSDSTPVAVGDDSGLPVSATPAAPVVAAATPGETELGDKQGIASVAVLIEGGVFSPQTITVPAGTIIAWTNLDPDTQSVTADDGSFDSGPIGQGEAWVEQFDQPGTYAYHSTIDPTITGTIVVTP